MSALDYLARPRVAQHSRTENPQSKQTSLNSKLCKQNDNIVQQSSACGCPLTHSAHHIRKPQDAGFYKIEAVQQAVQAG